MPSTGQKKLDQMQAYSKTPAGKAAIARAREKQRIKRGPRSRTKKINPKPLLKVVSNWMTIWQA